MFCPRSPRVLLYQLRRRRMSSGACQDTPRSNKPCATTISTRSVSPDCMLRRGTGRLGFAVRLVEGEASFLGSRGDYFWSGVGGTYFWVDPARDLFVLLMLQSSSPEQRPHYRTLLRNMVYAAVDC
jgi:CubicO group peptidase (beta-lactamase class C family)